MEASVKELPIVKDDLNKQKREFKEFKIDTAKNEERLKAQIKSLEDLVEETQQTVRNYEEDQKLLDANYDRCKQDKVRFQNEITELLAVNSARDAEIQKLQAVRL